MSPMPSRSGGGNSRAADISFAVAFVLLADLMSRCRYAPIARRDGQTASSVRSLTPIRIGIDVEDRSRFEPELLQYVLSRGDVTRNFLGTSGIDCSLGAALFSAKETFYKCLTGVAQAEFDYGDVGIEFIDGSDVFYGRLLRPVGRLPMARAFIGRYVVVGDQVATAMILPREGSDIRA
jgi:4'-phosphopantetheinyl transferase EntD